ncbi:RFC checkpoint protein Rad17 [Coemansia sp. RSA 638]|nr:RFC checkpoint protein Rad17 [Coemansia sp. RSA 638]
MALKAEHGDDDFDLEVDSDLEALVASCQAQPVAATKKRRRALTDRPRLRPTKTTHAPIVLTDIAGGENQLWWQRYEPHTADELAVHKRRVDEVRDWLMAAVQAVDGHRVLVLEGPAGAGKSTCVRVLARDLGLRIVEWENPSDVRLSTAGDAMGAGVVRAFGDFLVQAQRYGAAGARMVLVDDLPNVAHGATRDAFNSAVNRFAAVPARESCPMVIVVSDVHAEAESGLGSIADAVSGLVSRHTIRFLPVAPTIVQRGLKRIVQHRKGLTQRQRLPPAQQALIKQVSNECQGDIRAAVTMLQIEAGAPRRTTLDLFHALGKILHAKRSNGVLETSADDVLRRSPVDLSTLRVFLHESYPSHCQHMDEASASAAFLSDADVLTRLGSEPAEWCATSVAVRGHMFAHAHPEFASDVEPAETAPSWQAFRRPQFFDAVRQTSVNTRLLRDAASLRVHGLTLGRDAVDELSLWAPLAVRREGADPRWRVLTTLAAPLAAAELLPTLPPPSLALPPPEKLVLSDDDIDEFSDS